MNLGYQAEQVKSVDFNKIVKKTQRYFEPQQRTKRAELVVRGIGEATEQTITAEHSLDATYLDRSQIIRWYEDTLLSIPNISARFDSKEENLIAHILGPAMIQKSKVKDRLSRYNFEVLVKEIGDAFGDSRERSAPLSTNAKEKQVSLFEYRPQSKDTKNMPPEHIDALAFLEKYLNNKKVWYSPDTFVLKESRSYDRLVKQRALQLLKELPEIDDPRDIARQSVQTLFAKKKANEYKTPLEVVRWDSTPEYEFIERLFRHTSDMRTWVKSRTQGFYTITYFFEDRDRNFNPDFVICLKDGNTLIIETKTGQDINKENAYKMKALEDYINALNAFAENKKSKKKTQKGRYFGYMLRPEDYPEFFAEVIARREYGHEPEFHRKLKRFLQGQK